MTSDPHDSHREDQDQPAEPEPADEPEDEPAHRPGVADALATLAASRAMLTGDEPGRPRQAAASGSLPGLHRQSPRPRSGSWSPRSSPPGWSALAPGAVLDIGMIRAAILDVIAEAEAELRAARRTSPAASRGLTMAAIATPRWRPERPAISSLARPPGRPAPMRRTRPPCPKEARAMTTPTAAPGPGVHTGSFGGYPFPAEVVARIINLLISGAVFAPSLTRQGTVRSTVAWPTAKPTGWAWLEELQPFPTIDVDDDAYVVAVAKLGGIVDLS